jgi:chromosome segregation ATPase
MSIEDAQYITPAIKSLEREIDKLERQLAEVTAAKEEVRKQYLKAMEEWTIERAALNQTIHQVGAERDKARDEVVKQFERIDDILQAVYEAMPMQSDETQTLAQNVRDMVAELAEARRERPGLPPLD